MKQNSKVSGFPNLIILKFNCVAEAFCHAIAASMTKFWIHKIWVVAIYAKKGFDGTCLAAGHSTHRRHLFGSVKALCIALT
jgi:hypothetical protein